MDLPEGFLREPVASWLIDPSLRPQAYQELFPPLNSVLAGGIMTTRIQWQHGITNFLFLYFAALDGAHENKPAVRFSGTHQAAGSLFTVIARGDEMDVAWYYPTRKKFFGKTEHGLSPFGEKFGIEPQDLGQILALGNQMASKKMRVAGWFNRNILQPQKQGGVQRLKRVILEPETGLPREAVWKMRARSIAVHYLGWQMFIDELTGDRHLMPSELEIDVKWGLGRIRLKIDRYQFNKTLEDRMMQLPESARNFEAHTLSELK